MGDLWGDEFSKDPSTSETPKRVLKAWVEMTSGLTEDPAEPLKKVFDCTHDEIVLLKGIPFISLCEHHLMPFQGVAHIGYIPKEKVVGLSKIPRSLDILARRPQIQESLTQEMANVINETLSPVGVGVVISAEHGCMSCRGVHKAGVQTVTSCMLGAFRDRPEARAEFMELIK